MIRAAPRRCAARTAHRPTAPSPTTATTLPDRTPALTAAWWPVLITSERARNDRIISSECLEPGTGTREAPVRGRGDGRVWPLADLDRTGCVADGGAHG